MSPIFIDPNIDPPPPPDHVVSPDEILTATVTGETTTGLWCKHRCLRQCTGDADTTVPPGVYLTADYSATFNWVTDPTFVNPGQNAARFPADWVIGDGQVTIPDPADSYRVFLIGDKVSSTSSAAPPGLAPDNGAMPVTAGQILNLSITASASVDQREVRWQVYTYNAEGVAFGGARYVSPNSPILVGAPTAVTGTFTVPDDGSAYVAVAFVAEGGFGGTVTISDPVIADAATETVEVVRFMRINPDGTETPVRSGDPAIAVGGYAIAYDNEAPLGQPVQYYAVPIYADGSEGPPSQALSIILPFPDGDIDCWLKPVLDPGLASPAMIIFPLPTFAYEARQQLSAVVGSRYRAGGWDWHLNPGEATFTFWTPSCVERDQILAALTSGPLLFQTRPKYQIDDFYCLAGAVTETPMETALSDPGRTWSVALVPVERPSSADSGLVIPGRSYADTHAVAGTYQKRYDTWPLYADVQDIEGVIG